MTALLASVPIETTMTQEGKNTYVEAYGMTIGEMLQKIGTNALRDNFHKNVWINALAIEIQKNPGNYIITDCRFKNEAQAIKDMGGILVRIERPVNPIAENSGRDLKHPSEVDLDDYEGFDHVIINDGTVEQLHDKALGVLFQADVRATKNA